MSKLGQKIIKSLEEATAGDLARVTVNGVTWIRKAELDSCRENLETLTRAIERLSAIIMKMRK